MVAAPATTASNEVTNMGRLTMDLRSAMTGLPAEIRSRIVARARRGPSSSDSAAGDFVPRTWLRGGHVQSIVGATPPRTWFVRRASRLFRSFGRRRVLAAADAVRLEAWIHPAQVGTPSSVAVLIHGWEGSAESPYVLSLGSWIWSRGTTVVRLNLRDHGGTHALNRELFHSCRLEEVVGAVSQVVTAAGTAPVTVIGFSLGGNFALRVALRAPEVGLVLRQVIAVCPPLDPQHVLESLERSPRLYERHFVRRWRISLTAKAATFPEEYDPASWSELETLRAMTERLVLEHTSFPSLDDYLDGYSIRKNALASLAVPATIIASEDDPIVPVEGLRRMPAHSGLNVDLQAYGGHCGFIERFAGSSWLDRRIGRLIVELDPRD